MAKTTSLQCTAFHEYLVMDRHQNFSRTMATVAIDNDILTVWYLSQLLTNLPHLPLVRIRIQPFGTHTQCASLYVLNSLHVWF